MAKRRWRTVYADERVIERSLYWRRLVSKSLIAIVCEFNRKLVLGGRLFRGTGWPGGGGRGGAVARTKLETRP